MRDFSISSFARKWTVFARSSTTLKGRLLILCLFVATFSISMTLYTHYTIYQNKVAGSAELSESLVKGPYVDSIIRSIRLDDMEGTKELSGQILKTTSISRLVVSKGGEVILDIGNQPEEYSLSKYPIVEEQYVYSDDDFDYLEASGSTVEVNIADIDYYVDKNYGKYTDAFIKNLVLTFIVLLVILTPIMWLIYVSIITPISDTVNDAKRYIQGKTKSIPRSAYKDEQSIIQNTFHDLVNEVEKQKNELIQREMTAVEKQDLADQANLAKEQFIKQISHMVRTPSSGLVSTQGLQEKIIAQLNYEMVKEQNKKGDKEYLDLIKYSAYGLPMMLNLIDTAKKDISKISETFDNVMNVVDVVYNGVSICPVAVDIETKMERISSVIPQKYVNKDIDFNFEIIKRDSLGENLVVKADWIRLYQIINELVKNAYRFTDSGSVDLKVLLLDRDKDVELKVVVKDTGCGIPQDRFREIFDIFQIGEEVSRKQNSDLGAGLTTISAIADAMNGQIRLEESVLGQGSVFTFSVLLEKSADPVSENILNDDTPERKLNLLYVEDKENMRFLFKLYAEQLNFDVSLADSAKKAFEKFKHNKFDALVVDVHMPEENGIDFVKRVRAYESDRKLEPSLIFSMTAENSQSNAEECLAAGFNEFLIKPFTEITFNEIENRIIHKDSIYNIETNDA